jgi:molybdopterin-guanine dinucleotide biosynthesis protein A
MLGVVLCGGQSSRMGTDKGLLKFNDKTWVQIAIDKLHDFQIPAIVSVNKNQFPEYSTVFFHEILIPDNDSLQLHGPLVGLLSAHLKYPEEDLLVIACDMPLIDTDIISQLLTNYKTGTACNAFVYTNNGELEPMPGIYRATGLVKIAQLYKDNQLSRHSMKYILGHISTSTIPLPDDKKNSFRNFNRHAELDDL